MPRDRERTRSKSPGKKHHHLHLPSLQTHAKKSDLALNNEKHDGYTASTPQSPLNALESPTRPERAHRVGFAVDADRDESPPRRPAASPSGIATPASHTSRHDYFAAAEPGKSIAAAIDPNDLEKQLNSSPEKLSESDQVSEQFSIHYTDYYRSAPPKSYVQSLRPWNGRLTKDKWLHVMVRPFILFAYPAVLWSSMVYALAVGWLIVLSESVSSIYKDRDSYNFTSLQVGLVYISPFVGGVLGTAVAGKISDLVVRLLARRNDGI